MEGELVGEIEGEGKDAREKESNVYRDGATCTSGRTPPPF